MSFAALDVSPDSPAAYRGAMHGEEARVVLDYLPAQGTEPLTELIASSSDDPSIGRRGPEGVQAVAQTILRHFTGDEPDQALLEALTMDQGDRWTAADEWTLTTAELTALVDG